MFLPISAGLYIVLAICAMCTYLLTTQFDSLADYPDHPQFQFKSFLMLLNSVCFIYLLIWLIGVYIGTIISILL